MQRRKVMQKRERPPRKRRPGLLALAVLALTLPFGAARASVQERNGRSVVVRVNDRGPFVGTRIADVSAAAAASLGMLRRGLARARIEILGHQ